jgi:hypothetical protein
MKLYHCTRTPADNIRAFPDRRVAAIMIETDCGIPKRAWVRLSLDDAEAFAQEILEAVAAARLAHTPA